VTLAASGTPTHDWVEVLVADTSIGILDGIGARTTEPLFSTKAPGQGTGLGLGTVKAFVERTKGIMRIDSKPGGHDPRVGAGCARGRGSE
jgi:signal transduction histidine kinase